MTAAAVFHAAHWYSSAPIYYSYLFAFLSLFLVLMFVLSWLQRVCPWVWKPPDS